MNSKENGPRDIGLPKEEIQRIANGLDHLSGFSDPSETESFAIVRARLDAILNDPGLHFADSPKKAFGWLKPRRNDIQARLETDDIDEIGKTREQLKIEAMKLHPGILSALSFNNWRSFDPVIEGVHFTERPGNIDLDTITYSKKIFNKKFDQDFGVRDEDLDCITPWTVMAREDNLYNTAMTVSLENRREDSEYLKLIIWGNNPENGLRVPIQSFLLNNVSENGFTTSYLGVRKESDGEERFFRIRIPEAGIHHKPSTYELTEMNRIFTDRG